MAKVEVIEVYTPPFRVAFPELVEPSDFGDKLEYNLQCLFNKAKDISWFSNAILECGQKNNMIDAQGNWIKLKYPELKDGDTCITLDDKVPYDGHPGHWVLKLKSSSDKNDTPFPMDIIVVDKNNNATRVDAKEIYGGCWCRALVRFMRYDNKFGTGIAMRCDNLQFLGHDEPFSMGGSGPKTSSVKVFGAAPEVQGLPSHVSAATPAAAPGAPPVQAAPGAPPVQAAPGAPPVQAAPGAPPVQAAPGAPPVQAAPGAPPVQQQAPVGNVQSPAPNVAGQQQPPSFQNAAGAQTVTPPSNAVPTMGPNAQSFRYDQWVTAGYDDARMRTEGIIL